MFWVKLNDIRPYLAQQYVFTDDDNNLPRYSLDDFFKLNMYTGDIIKTKNLRNLSLKQMFPDTAAYRHAQDSIEQRLRSFNQDLWVPPLDVLQARAEAEEEARAAAEEAELAALEEAEEQAEGAEGEGLDIDASTKRAAKIMEEIENESKSKKSKSKSKVSKTSKSSKSSKTSKAKVKEKKEKIKERKPKTSTETVNTGVRSVRNRKR